MKLASPVSFGSLNPLSGVSMIGMSPFLTGLLIIAIVVVVICLIGVLIFMRVVKKQYFLNIRVFKNIGNIPTEIALFKAKPVAMGMAGDQLWRVAPNSVWTMPFKIVKWLSVGTKQTKANEFWYWIRSDGEWVNFILSDIDKMSSQMNVKFLKEDMRLQRLATDRLLEQRLMNKSFWDKWGNTIMTIILFLVIAVATVLVLYQVSKLLDKIAPLVDSLVRSLSIVERTCPALTNQTAQGGINGLIPVQ